MRYCLEILLFLFVNYTEGSFRCDYKYSVVSKTWFKHFVIPATWYDARLRCSLEQATLASPITPEIEAEMTHIINNFFTSKSEIFTGIHATFSQGDYFTIEGIRLNDMPLTWSENEPNNLGNQESCITFNGKGEISDQPCGETRPYICYRPEDKPLINSCGTVDPEYILDKRTRSCYKFHAIPRNFSRAHFTCSAEGGHLVIINSEIEVQILKELFARYPEKNMLGRFWKDVAFIGFSDWDERGDWRTIHGQTLPAAGYNRFSPGEPNNASTGEFCGSMYRNGLLNDLWCDKPAPFICEKKPNFPPVCASLPDDKDG